MSKNVETLEKRISDLQEQLRVAKRKERAELDKVRDEYFIEFCEYLLNRLDVKKWQNIDLKDFADCLDNYHVKEPLDKEVKDFKELIREMRECRKKKKSGQGVSREIEPYESEPDYVVN